MEEDKKDLKQTAAGEFDVFSTNLKEELNVEKEQTKGYGKNRILKKPSLNYCNKV